MIATGTRERILCDKRRNYQRHHRNQFNQNIQAGTARILERIANRIAYYRSLMGITAFSVHGPAYGNVPFDQLLGIIPGAAGIGLKNSEKHTGNQYAGQQPAQHAFVDEPHNDRRRDG